MGFKVVRIGSGVCAMAGSGIGGDDVLGCITRSQLFNSLTLKKYSISLQYYIFH